MPTHKLLAQTKNKIQLKQVKKTAENVAAAPAPEVPAPATASPALAEESKKIESEKVAAAPAAAAPTIEAQTSAPPTEEVNHVNSVVENVHIENVYKGPDVRLVDRSAHVGAVFNGNAFGLLSKIIFCS